MARMRIYDYAGCGSAIMRGLEVSTSLPFMKMVTLRVLDFAITDVLAKMVQMPVTGWDG